MTPKWNTNVFVTNWGNHKSLKHTTLKERKIIYTLLRLPSTQSEAKTEYKSPQSTSSDVDVLEFEKKRGSKRLSGRTCRCQKNRKHSFPQGSSLPCLSLGKQIQALWSHRPKKQNGETYDRPNEVTQLWAPQPNLNIGFLRIFNLACDTDSIHKGSEICFLTFIWRN